MFFPILRIVPFFLVPCTCFFLSCVPAAAPANARPGLRAWFLDVGQGDACLLRTPGKQWFLYDIGNEAGSLMAFLRHVRADTLQAAFISHPDLDHFGALSALLRDFPVKKVYLPSGSNPTPAWLGLLRDLDAFEGELDTLFVGDTLIWDGGIKVRTLWPEPRSTYSANNQSTVLRIEYEGKRILLTGDIEDAAENELVDQGKDLRADILKVAHHGSRTSSGLRFVSEVRPRWAVISCDSSVYGHPHSEAVADLALVMGNSARILRTDREGTIGFEVDEHGIRRVDAWE